jgi:hypothetical protein
VATQIKLDVYGKAMLAEHNAGGCRWFARLLVASCITLGATVTAAASAERIGAEYAIRWNAAEGGPGTADQVLAVLKQRARRANSFEVEYYDLAVSSPAPGFATILRRRVDDAGRTEWTWKLRGDHALAEWSCPLRNVRQTKSEVDVTIGGERSTTRAYSYSCESKDAEFATPGASPKPRNCASSVRRWQTERLKVEEWRLPGNVLMIEVSGADTDTPEALERFRNRVADPLLAAGIRPSIGSKTVQSACE